ncbi:MAG: hypothetical protein L0387_24230 [Acidobacteria bacterium]|nr:hypothetical protein [Acidobacteriota bacterium]MCI0717915.1 hypothetical protein [Acidobacteriota bacterium]
MINVKAVGIAGCMVLLCSFVFPLSAHADSWNQKTTVTLGETMWVPGATLPPGTYVFKLVNSLSDRHIVRVLNEDETHVYATILAIPNYRLEPTGKTEFGYWEMPEDYPVALRSWFYPGKSYGHEFAYPKKRAAEIAARMKTPVPAIPEEMEAKLTVPPPTPDAPEPEEFKTTVITEEKPNPEPVTATKRVETTAEVKPTEVARTLPETAGVFPLVGLMGSFSVGLGLIIRAVRQR